MHANADQRKQRTPRIDRPAAVIFDLDGTLIDSEPHYRTVDEEFAAAKGIYVPRESWEQLVGIAGHKFIEMLRDQYGLTGDTEELLAEKDRLFLKHVRGRMRVFQPVRELILALLLRDIPVAVATSSRRTVLEAMLRETGLSRAFSRTVSADDVAHPKPAPDIFFEAARRLKVAPESCWVIEDSQYGVQAARASGMRVIAVPVPEHQAMPAFASADHVVTGGPDHLDPPAIMKMLGLEADPDAGPVTIESFRRTVCDYYRRSRRTMPWRETADPYSVLVSELMLQQTQSERVIPRYEAFLQQFPTVQALASASLQDVLAAWQGLGYNRRGKYLHDAARRVVSEFGGRVPSDLRELRSLPGVGPYTAGAVAAFAYSEPVVFIETNIRRAFLQVFFGGRTGVTDRQILPLVSATVDCRDPRNWYYALMDYGAHLSRLYGNANRRSAHYTVQSRFAGSVRQVRGGIVRALTRNGATAIEDLERQVAPGDERFAAALESLERDGMVVCDSGAVRLP